MDKFSRRESLLLGYSPPRSLINHTSSPKTPYIDSDDVDFNDVFGGPPRRSSTHDVGHSFSEPLESTFSGYSEAPRFRNPWSGLIGKPVSGEEIENRRRYHSDDFFDDIFRNDDSVSSMPRKNGWDPFASSPGSRVLNPVRRLPPKSSLPQQFSLSPKSAKGMDLPTLGSATCSLYNNKGGASNGISYSHSPNTSLSRFSSQRQQSRNDVLTSHHQSPLYNEFSLSSEGSSNLTYSGKTGTGGNSKEDSNSREVTINSNQFHFSIYKWASKGVPLLMPLGGANCSRLKQKGKFERCLSTKGRIESESITAELPMRTPGNSDFSSTANMAANTKSFSVEQAEQESNSLLVTRERLEARQIVDEAAFPVLESETPSRLQGNNEKTRKAGKEKIMVSKKSSVNADVGKNVKKLDVKTTSFNNAKDNKASLQGSPMDSRDKLDRNRVKGKVKEFVNMFNQEASSKQKLDSRNQSSRWKKRGTFRPENGASVSKSGTSEKIHMPDVNKINLADASITADEDLKQSQKQQSTMVNYILSDIFLEQKDNSGSVRASISEGFTATVGDTDETFLVKELPQDENKLPQIGKDPEDMEVANAKIQHWSKGKEGNIRSLLSTLQYVLWPESGWKPVPLADIIEGDAVKRAYQKTLLCLHPDKLQQKGASLHQKFIAEKVFGILQEAWIDFNTQFALNT